MKRDKICFWVLIGLLVPALGIGSVFAILGDPKSAEVFTSLGYPAYLSPFLGVARVLALIVLFIPRYKTLKEWAYAGLVFDVVGAIYSQLADGKPFNNIIFPILALGLIFGSYYFHYKRLKYMAG